MALYFKNIAIYAKQNNLKLQEPLYALLKVLQDNNCNVFLDDVCKNLLGESCYKLIADQDIDLILSLGGDGSLLQIARKTFASGVPILGINIGKLGFLADISTQQFSMLVDILHGDYKLEERQVLQMSLWRNGISTEGNLYAVNEVVLFNGNIARLIEFKVIIDGQFVMQQRSDGIIIATPTGSTAYALSAGGPILYPGLANLVLVPLCAHSLSARPIVINDTSHIEIRTANKQHIIYKISCDGQLHLNVEPTDEIHITKAKHKLKLVHPSNYNYYDLLKHKLGWYYETIRTN